MKENKIKDFNSFKNNEKYYGYRTNSGELNLLK